MKKNPIITIIMSCFNGEKFIDKSVKSILKQTYKNWELIFWDNNSNDGSKKKFYLLMIKELNIINLIIQLI